MDMDRFISSTTATRNSMLVRERQRAALEAGMSPTQEWALDWLRKNTPAARKEWRGAGISATTLCSLVNRSLVNYDADGRAVALPWHLPAA